MGEAGGFVHEALAECLLALGRPDEARAQFGRAFAAPSADAWVVEHEAPRLERRKTVSGECEG